MVVGDPVHALGLEQRCGNTKGYSSTYIAMGFANVLEYPFVLLGHAPEALSSMAVVAAPPSGMTAASAPNFGTYLRGKTTIFYPTFKETGKLLLALRTCQ